MAKASSRAPVLGPAFIRLLARFSDADLPRTPPVLTERLAQWFDWNRALVLSRALDGNLPAAEGDRAGDDRDVDDMQDAGCAEVRQSLVQAIDADIAPALDYQPYRQHCVAVQRAMQSATGLLRGRLRDALARQSPAKARLAEVDAVMEATLSPRELMLLARVPSLLGLHYQHLRDTEKLQYTQTLPDESLSRLRERVPEGRDRGRGRSVPSPPTPLPQAGEGSRASALDDTSATPAAGPWLARFRQDMRMALLAELEVRFHPIDGLLAALRTR
ncbi:DUF3348 domain-containing protein [Rhodanobacter sp. DHB23]|uniref:DUF3348 domain-containing protein n=1 Tax=Rhodanobacter sp. DHB23 TaxID=2775923 RepID=UPI00177F6D76|nr:DUF3348 domain-containing protein [Rhodanobacter sp. DHB23]MBD8874366.1 DUF3348 domain-containing protein [Rhodanobacter sp. DHB23]